MRRNTADVEDECSERNGRDMSGMSHYGGYGDFASVYDLLTFNVPYDEIAAYYAGILEKIAPGKRLLDMGCGTGSLTVRLAAMGFDVIGQDASPDMLSVAAGKSADVRWICQDMAHTDIGGEVDAVISTLDSINHLESADAIAECFRRAAESLVKGGVFVFDVNTVFKHREILAENVFVYDIDGVYCVWTNTFDPNDNGVDIDLDLFFEREDGTYTRGSESFREISLDSGKLCGMLRAAGFEIVNVLEYLTYNDPKANSEKLLISAKKV